MLKNNVQYRSKTQNFLTYWEYFNYFTCKKNLAMVLINFTFLKAFQNIMKVLETKFKI